MKKLIALLLVLMTFLTACSSGNSGAENKDNSEIPGVSDSSADSVTDNEEVPIDDGSVTVMMPTIVYFSEENSVDDANTIEYDEYGNMKAFNIKNEFTSKHEASEINTDDSGIITKVKNWHRDTYYFEYNDDGSMSKISGLINYGENNFNFNYSDKEGAAYELTVYYDKNYVVEQYSEDYRLIEQLYYTYDNTTEHFHRRYYTYDENGLMTKWEKAYDGRYDFTDTYSASDFDEMGHCMTQYLIDGYNFQYTEYVRQWESATEKDSAGRVIKDTHTCDEENFIITYDYKFEGDSISEYAYTVVDTKNDSYAKVVYSPVKVKCDSLQLALIEIYSQDVYANNFGSFRSLTVDWAK